jgi:hypothetical protein
VGSLLIPLPSEAGRGNDPSVAQMDLTNSKNLPTWTLPFVFGCRGKLTDYENAMQNLTVISHM